MVEKELKIRGRSFTKIVIWKNSLTMNQKTFISKQDFINKS